ncbi:MAG: PhnD/SsuA/transferrin family substrate-binding protein [Gallionellaceae bacterium]|nr:PhnD/SsuA/transferrin family substrate-binding protein [Gallionellaceae bacterium]
MLLALISGTLLSAFSYSAESIKIGVLAFRPKPQTLVQWQPLATALKQAIPENNFEVVALTYPELEQAVTDRQVDFVLTNPGHYVLLSKRKGLSAPLATLGLDENGRHVSAFGGVIFTRADQQSINNLLDLRGKTVATAGTESLGGYQMQAYEFSLKGIKLPQDVSVISTGMPHDTVIQEVLSARAEAGFVRTGVLESMAREGKLEMQQLKILNAQKWGEFPMVISTRLYPEWPFVARKDIDESLARKITAALFSLDENVAATKAMEIHGFFIPADYTPVVDLLKELRLPPYEAMPFFTPQDIFTRYRSEFFVGVLTLILILSLVVRLFWTNRGLTEEKRIVSLQSKRIQEGEQNLINILNVSPIAVRIAMKQGHQVAFFNQSYVELLKNPKIMEQNPQQYYARAEDYDEILAELALGNAVKNRLVELHLTDGETVWALSSYMRIKYQDEEAVLGWFFDITESKRAEAAILRSNKELEQFSYSISHDMRQPLRMISSYIKLLEIALDKQLSVEQKKYMSFVTDGATRIDSMMLGLLEYSRIGRKGEPATWIDSRAALNEALLFLQPEVKESQAYIRVQGDWPRIFASHDEILRLLQNLVGNALKFRIAERPPEVLVLSEIVEKNWRVSITDNGVGIQPSQIGRLFQVFQRLQSQAAYEGTGIGLALCRKIVERHGGTIGVDSAGEGKGCRFYFEMPMQKETQ